MGKASCHNCVYACWDLGQAMLGMATGFASRPMCANHPDAPGLMRPTPVGNTCRNYRPRPATPEGDVKRIPLGGGQYAYVDAADYEWLSQYSWHIITGGYPGRCDQGKTFLMHREIMKPPKGMVVDHIDGNKMNSCRFNLRVCTHAENLRNCAKHARTSSRFKGVGYHKQSGKYYAKLGYNGQSMWLGLFDDEVEAARAYDHKAVEYGGPFARLNLPEEWPPERIQQVYRPQADPEAEGGKVVKSAKGARRRRKEGKRGSEDGRRRPAGEKKAERSEDKKAGRTRKTPPTRRASPGRPGC